LYDLDLNFYLGPVYVGTPLQAKSDAELSWFTYDTGSGYLAVTSVDCVSCGDGFKYFNRLDSSTFKFKSEEVYKL